MKLRVLSFLGIGAISLAVACKNANDESTSKDSSSTTTTTTTVDNTSANAGLMTSSDGRKYVIRKRTTTTSSTQGSTDNSSMTDNNNNYDTVWLYTGTDERYYTLHGRDTLYFNTDEWNTWWNDVKTDDELKTKSGNVKVKVDDDGSWKVKDKDAGEKTKMNDKGEVKNKPKG